MKVVKYVYWTVMALHKEGIIKKLLRKITAVPAAGLMFPNRTLSVIDFGLKAFADADVA